MRVLISGPVSWNLLVQVPELPAAEPHTVFARGHHQTIGGTSAGKALNLRRLGVEVTLSTLVGDDEIGVRLKQQLTAAGVDVLAGRSANGSEQHVNLMDPGGRRLSIYLNLPVPTTPPPGEQEALAAADVVVADLADHSRRVLRAARALGKPIWCDLHDYDGHSDFHTEFRDTADVLFVSDERLPDPVAFLRASGKRLAVCTRGARGALALDETGNVLEMPGRHVPDLVDTNGAGDAFFAGFLTAHQAGRPLHECLEQATDTAVACLRSPHLAP